MERNLEKENKLKCLYLKEESSQHLKKDIVTELYERNQIYDVLDQVFLNLDLESIKNAELVSRKWRDAIASVGWKSQINKKTLVSHATRDMNILVHQSITPDLLEKEFGYKIVYFLIAENLRKLDHNWRNGIWMGKKSPITLSPPCLVPGPRHGVNVNLFPCYNNNQAYGMNSHWNVTADSDSQITIRNRFGLNKIIKVLDLPIIAPRPLPSNAPQRPLIYSVKVSNKFIAVGFYYHPEVCVWDVATLDLVKVLDGDLFDSNRVPLLNFWHSICLHENNLITFHGGGAKIICSRYEFSTTPNVKDDVFKYRHNLIAKRVRDVRSIRDSYMDGNVICILFLSKWGALKVETRSVSNFNIIKEINVRTISPLQSLFHYVGGIACAYDGHYSIWFWDAISGSVLKTLPYSGGLCNLKMLKDKFLVLFTLNGQLKILNLKKILDPEQLEDSTDTRQLLHADFHVSQTACWDHIKPKGNPKQSSLQVVDGLQIGVTTQVLNWRGISPVPYSLYTFDFSSFPYIPSHTSQKCTS